MNGKVKDADRLIYTFLTTGKDLLRRLELAGISDSQLPKNLSDWIKSTTEQLLGLMPKEFPDYTKVNEIRSQYINNQSVLLLSAASDVRIVLKNLAIAHD